MARLKTVGSGLARLPSSVAWMPDGRQQRDRYRDAQPWRKWYKTTRWRELRKVILMRDLFTCQMQGCRRVIAKSIEQIVDHRRAHRGDEVLFWDPGNLQVLCKACHDGRKQREEHGR